VRPRSVYGSPEADGGKTKNNKKNNNKNENIQISTRTAQFGSTIICINVCIYVCSQQLTCNTNYFHNIIIAATAHYSHANKSNNRENKIYNNNIMINYIVIVSI
jgi:hypothetical protein